MADIPDTARDQVVGFRNRLRSATREMNGWMPLSGPRYRAYPRTREDRVLEVVERQLDRNAEFRYFLQRLRDPTATPPDTLLGRHLFLPINDGPNNIFSPFLKNMELSTLLVVQFMSAGATLARHVSISLPREGVGLDRSPVDPRRVVLQSLDEPFALLPEWDGQPWRRRYLLGLSAALTMDELKHGLGLGDYEKGLIARWRDGRTAPEKLGSFIHLLDRINWRLGRGPDFGWRPPEGIDPDPALLASAQRETMPAKPGFGPCPRLGSRDC